MSMLRVGPTLAVLALLQACATSTHVTRLEPNLASRGGACNVQVLPRGSAVAEGLVPIATIESHIKRNMFLGGRVTLLDEAYTELRAKACEVGGDVVRLDDHMESQAAEMTHVHAWATVFKSK